MQIPRLPEFQTSARGQGDRHVFGRLAVAVVNLRDDLHQILVRVIVLRS